MSETYRELLDEKDAKPHYLAIEEAFDAWLTAIRNARQAGLYVRILMEGEMLISRVYAADVSWESHTEVNDPRVLLAMARGE